MNFEKLIFYERIVYILKKVISNFQLKKYFWGIQMASSDISDIVIFKKKLELNYEIKQKYVGLKMKENNILSFNKFSAISEIKFCEIFELLVIRLYVALK